MSKKNKNEVKDIIDAEVTPAEEIPEEEISEEDKAIVDEVLKTYWVIRKPEFMIKKKDSEPKPKKDIMPAIKKAGMAVAAGLGLLAGIAIMKLGRIDDSTYEEDSTPDDDYPNWEKLDEREVIELENDPTAFSDENTDEIKSEVNE